MNGIANLGFQTHQPHQQKTQRFIPFSANTTGKCGRPVFIDAKLLPDFLINIDLKTYRGLQIVRGIEMLRSVGGGINAYQSKLKAAKHMSVIGELEIYYYIAQQNPSGNEVSGVYITELSPAPSHSSAAGSYIVKDGIAISRNLLQFEGDQACISAAASIQKAVDHAIPHIDLDGWGKSPEVPLYFVPESLSNQRGVWITPTQKQAKTFELAADLATIIKASQKTRINSDKPLRIRVFNSACQILSLALNQIHGHLDKLGFELIDPDESAPSAIKKLASRNARLSPDTIKTTKISANFKLIKVRHDIAKLLSLYGRDKSAKNVLENTANPANAIAISQNLMSKNNYFLSAVKQAKILSQWDQ